MHNIYLYIRTQCRLTVYMHIYVYIHIYTLYNHCSVLINNNIYGIYRHLICWSWNSSTLATSCEELTHWKRLWGWEGLGAGVKGDNRGWDGWMVSPTQWAWVWVNSGSWWWTGRPGVLRFMGSQRVGHDWVTKLNWIACLCFPGGSVVKNLSAMQETQVWSLCQEDPLEEGLTTHSSNVA